MLSQKYNTIIVTLFFSAKIEIMTHIFLLLLYSVQCHIYTEKKHCDDNNYT